jgi:hypothetical protein
MKVRLGNVCAFAASIVALVGAAHHATAQNTTAQKDTPPPSQWSVVMVSQVKPEARLEWEASQKEITAAYKKAGVPSRAVLQTVFGNVNEFISVTPLAKFAEMDGDGPLERALGVEGAAKLRRRIAGFVTSQHRYASLAVPDVAIRTQNNEPLPYGMITSYTLQPGKAQEFNAYMKDEYIPMLKKAEVSNFFVNQTVFGGANERVTVRLMKKLGEIDDGPIARRALGAEGAQKLAARAAGIIASSRATIVRYRTDLSYELAKPTQVTTR